VNLCEAEGDGEDALFARAHRGSIARAISPEAAVKGRSRGCGLGYCILIRSERGKSRVPAYISVHGRTSCHLRLRKKRAELAGEVVTVQLRLGKLRDDLDAVDRTMRVFDPSQHPEKIRRIDRRKGDRM
jgi:hypothetical protein